MNIEELRSYCINKPGVTESFPFDEDTLVFKVADKMFCLTTLNKAFSINLKCIPEHAIELREQFEDVLPGYHMNKKHWNTINITGRIPDSKIIEWVDLSYDLVVKSMPKKKQQELIELKK